MCCFPSTLNKSNVLVMSCTEKVGLRGPQWVIEWLHPRKLVLEKVTPVSNMAIFMLFPVSTLNFPGVMVCVCWVFVSCPVFRRENPTFATTCSTPGLFTPLRMLLEQRALRGKQRFQVDGMGTIPNVEAEKVLILCGPAHVEEIW